MYKTCLTNSCANNTANVIVIILKHHATSAIRLFHGWCDFAIPCLMSSESWGDNESIGPVGNNCLDGGNGWDIYAHEFGMMARVLDHPVFASTAQQQLKTRR